MAQIILLGDLNVQNGSNTQDWAILMGYETEELLPLHIGLPHQSIESIYNKAGYRLIEFCIAHDLLTLNGLP